MWDGRLLLLACFTVATPLGAAGAEPLPTVGYRTRATIGSWQPLSAQDLAKTVEQAALEVLTRPGLMQIAKVDPKATERATEYIVELKSRLLDEAETHSVYLSFGSGTKSDLPSFESSDTISLKTGSRAEMLERVQKSAKRAAEELLAALRPALEQAKGSGAARLDLPVPERLPFQWADVEVPSAKLSAGSADLYSKKKVEREASLRLLTSLLLSDDGAARRLLEACVLRHSEADMRLGCLRGLAPAARRVPATQRVVIAAFRKDGEADVRREANEQMAYFSGMARDEAIQAWLEAAAKGDVVGPLDALGDLPNLDWAIAHCIVASGKRPKYQRSKRSCIALTQPLGHARRRALLMPSIKETNADSPYYLEGAGEREGSIGTEWQWAVEAVLERATAWDPELEEALWQRYRRELSLVAIETLADYAKPSPRLTDRLLEALVTGGHRASLKGLARVAKESPEARPKIREKLAEVLHTGGFPKTLRKEALQELVKQLEKEQGR